MGEIDVGGGAAADVHDQAGAVLGRGDRNMAEAVNQVLGLCRLRAGRGI